MKGHKIVDFSVTKKTEDAVLALEGQEALAGSPDNLRGSGVL